MAITRVLKYVPLSGLGGKFEIDQGDSFAQDGALVVRRRLSHRFSKDAHIMFLHMSFAISFTIPTLHCESLCASQRRDLN